MRKIIGVSGGKGGTGKSFVETNLALLLSEKNRSLLVDADVENPNVSILLNRDLIGNGELVKSFFPKIVVENCTTCGVCADTCRYHALFQMKMKAPILIDTLCHSCELCMRLCKVAAIDADYRGIGEIFSYDYDSNLKIMLGKLFPGGTKTAHLIAEMNAKAFEQVANNKNPFDFMIVDCAPGAHCDVEKALKGVDEIFCITEPTPLGAHDLKRTLQLARFLKKKACIIINRADMVQFNGEIEKISKDWEAPIIARIPLSREVMETYARGESLFRKYKSPDQRKDHPVLAAFLKILEWIDSN